MNNLNYELYSTYLKTKPLSNKTWNLITDLENYAGKPKEYYLSLLTNGRETFESLKELRDIKKERFNPFRKSCTTAQLRTSL